MIDTDTLQDNPANEVIKNPAKRKKPQGKMNIKTVVKGVIQGKKKKDIAVEAGSIAKSTESKINSVNNVIRSKEYKREVKTFQKNIEDEINRLIENIKEKNLNSVDYEKAVSSLEKLNKMNELLKGNVTDRKVVEIDDVKQFLDKA